MSIWNDHLSVENHEEVGTSDHGVVRAQFEYRPHHQTRVGKGATS